MADSLYLKVMGTPGLFWPDGRPVKLKVRKHLALFTYLSLEARSTYRRDELVELLWPARTAKGSQSLSMAFSVFRGFFGPDCVRGNHAIVQFAPPPVLLDLQQLQRGEILGTEIEPPLEVDGVLRDFEIDGAPGFQHWRDRKQAEFFPDVKAGILTFIDQARRSGDTSAMKAFADRLLGLDHLVEEAIETRMEVFAIQGDRFGALRIFEDWRRGLLTELGARPSDRIETLAARLRRRSPQSSALGDAAPIIPPQVERVFVGRAAEYRVLFEAWEAACRGQSSHVLIAGESGIGKSTLALRFGAAASLAGAVMARVQCFELEQRIAYGTIGALVTSLLDQPGAVATDPASLAEVARIVPRVRERFPNLPAPRPVEGEAVRLHFAEGTFALFDAIMEDQPLLLIVDDYPRADEASLSVLHMLLRRSVSGSLMVVLAGRPPEPDEPAQAGRIRKAVSYLPLRKVELGPLTDGECEELMRAALRGARREPGAPERRAIIRSAAGNPMALELLTQDWLAHPDQALAMVLTSMRSDVPRTALEAVEYDQLIDRILPQLAPKNRIALYLAAILGPRLNTLEHFRILGLSPTETMEALSEMIQGRLLRLTNGTLEFTNELIRARIYLKIPDGSRTRLHSRVADSLLKALQRGVAIPEMEIAWHCMRARRVREATPYLIRAVRKAITQGAPDEAARALSSGIAALRGRPKAEATLLLCETYREMGYWREALECLGPYARSRQFDANLRQAARIFETESKYELGQFCGQEIQAVTTHVIAAARRAEETPVRLHAARLAIKLASELETRHVVSSALEAIAEIAMESLSDRETAAVLLIRALADYSVRNNHTGVRNVARASRLIDQAGIIDTVYVDVQTGLGAFLCTSGSYAEALAPTIKAYHAASRLDNAALQGAAAANLAVCYHRLGHNDDLLKWALVARRHSESAKSGSHNRVIAERFCTFGYLLSGDRGKAFEALERLRQARKESQIQRVRQSAFTSEADFLWLTGERSKALQIAEEMFEEAPAASDIGLMGAVARWATLLSFGRRPAPFAEETLSESYQQIDRLDALDQAEVLCSLMLIGRRGTRIPDRIANQTRKALARLPTACSIQLQETGLSLPT